MLISPRLFDKINSYEFKNIPFDIKWCIENNQFLNYNDITIGLTQIHSFLQGILNFMSSLAHAAQVALFYELANDL